MWKNSFRIGLSIAAFLCISGQMARKEIQEVPSTQITAENEIEIKQELPKKQKKSAAKRSMDESYQMTMDRKSAARRSMEE